MRVLEGKNEFPLFWLVVLIVCLFFSAWNFAQGEERPAIQNRPSIENSQPSPFRAHATPEEYIADLPA